ncbi:MAG: putative addiction module antidote protein [Proteobacteria bacterium]|nr:putative addiction module antidote protein [Pseudomonadota bacterium]
MSKAIRKCNSVKTVKYDVALQLNSPIERAAYLKAWLDEAPEDASGFLRALGDVARAHGMARVARDTGLGRESLYKSLCVTGNPSFATVLKIAKALGVKLHAELA